MVRDIVNLLYRWLHDMTGSWWRERLPGPELFGPAAIRHDYRRLQRVVLNDDVSRTFFDEFASHRGGNRGDEEIGWVLLGLRLEEEVVVLATLPAGTARSASAVHVRFDSEAQALGSRIVRQQDKRLAIVGVVHTHPGSLRHPSDGDFHGDSLWVRYLRGGEGVFGIGTADGPREANSHLAGQPHMQLQGELCFSWYALATEDRGYRRLPVHVTPGPDLAGPLHPVWPTLEIHARPLNRLFRQLSGVMLEGVSHGQGAAGEPVLALNLKLAEPGESLRVLLDRHKVRFFLNRKGDLCAVEPEESNVERALYLILAELAANAGPAAHLEKEFVHGLSTPQ